MFKTKSVGMMLAFILLFTMVLAGCSTNEQGNSAATNQEEAAQQEQSADVEVRVIEHVMGSTKIEGTPERVVTLFQSATDTALQLGVTPVGAVESWVEQPWYLYIREQMEGVTNVGSETQPNLEEIIALDPDLIIAAKSRHEDIYEQLSAIAPTVMTEEHYFWKDTLKLSAEALNKQAEEQAFLAEWDQKVAEFKTKLGDQINSTVSVVDFRSDHARVFFHTFPNLILDEVGFAHPASYTEEGWGLKLTSKEHIPEMEADVVFDMTSLDRDDGRVDVRNEWTSHPLWANLQAVQNEQVHKVDPVIWTNGSGPIAAMKMLEDLYNFFELN